MTTSPAAVEDILTRLASLNVRARAMFGGYALYCDEKVVILIDDDRLLEDCARLRSVVQATADVLPVPKPRRKTAAKRKA